MTTVNVVADFMSEQELVDVIIELCGHFHLKVADFRPLRPLRDGERPSKVMASVTQT